MIVTAILGTFFTCTILGALVLTFLEVVNLKKQSENKKKRTKKHLKRIK